MVALDEAAAAAHQAVSPVAVIDIGSNSVRLVVFDGPRRSPVPLFNEKVLCGLGRRLAETGRLDESGVALAGAALRRFATLVRLMRVGDLRVVATAAVRDAANGGAFVAEIEKACGFKVRVLSGAEEAGLSALGVVSGIPEADGVMGDLGGGSLELVRLAMGEIGETATLPLGPFRLAGLGGYGAVRDFVDSELKKLGWLDRLKDRRLYLVGGAWRAIARIHMAQTAYPVRVIHHYRLDREVAGDLARLLGRQSKESLARIEGVSRRRVDTLPLAALVLRRLIKLAEPSEVIFSANGLREGLYYAGLAPAERREDPLIAACRDLARRDGRFAEHGPELAEFVAPLAERETAEQQRLRLAAALLSDITWRVHPDHRGEQAFGRILHAPFAGIDHQGRAFLAMIVYARYQGGIDDAVVRPAHQLLDAASLDRALRLGLGLRLAHTLSGGTPDVLVLARLKTTAQRLVLELPPPAEALAGEIVQRRLDTLARAMNREAQIRLGEKGR
jgi:exopolyphosphatase/guanosine-5'-triphosphate,3'-diphosphate pyrophosphatase